MNELFRYIEQSFALPSTTDAIDVASQSDFQTSLRSAVAQNEPPDQIRSIANAFLYKHFTTAEGHSFQLASQLLSFAAQLLTLDSPSEKAVNTLVETVFDAGTQTLMTSTDFLDDKELLNDTLVSVKLVTGFDRVNATDLVTMRQAVAFLEALAAERLTNFTAAGIRAALQRPIRIPKLFVDALKISASVTPPPPPPNPESDAVDRQRASLLTEQQALQSAYETIMALQPHEFAIKTSTFRAARPLSSVSEAEPAAFREPARHTETSNPYSSTEDGEKLGHSTEATAAAPTFLAVSPSAIERLGAGVQRILENASIDIANAPVSHVIASIKRQWQDVSRQLAPYQVPAPSSVFRVGVHLFAVQAAPTALQADSATTISALFRHAITRPVGIGNLQVVRQELIGYEAGEISHIENVLEGELLRRSTRREEVNELTITQETDTTQVEERDQQSTSRNELSTEAQKEASQQTTSVKDQTTTTDYGKLVENSKTSYARSVTDRAVNTLTQMVKLQRVQRERKTFTEKALHELDNRQNPKKVRGIYQWVDKRYKTRILNYGKRLLYDVVVPEPAAFLIDSLKKAVQPEGFQLTKPVDPQISPTDLNPGTYQYYATRYGVTGSVTPPPDEFLATFAHPDTKKLEPGVASAFAAYNIQIPDNYKAVSGYIQSVSAHFAGNPPVYNEYEFYIGENHWFRFGNAPNATVGTLNIPFHMDGESGDVPVTFRTYSPVVEFAYAIGINCKRTEKAYEQWQLKTHATIMQGYQRQLATYEDKLAQYQSAVRSQMAMTQNFAHDPSIEQEEMKKAFIFLLLGEHFWQAFHPTPNPGAFPPNPATVRDWGAMVAFFERAFEWENMMYTYYPYFWGRQARWGELILIQDLNPQFEAFLKAGAARVVIPVRPGFEAALAHYQETGDIWMGEEIPDMFSNFYVSIIEEIKARNFAPGKEICVSEWDVRLPTTLVLLKEDATLPEWKPTVVCNPPADA